MTTQTMPAQGPVDGRAGRLALDGKYGEVLGPFVALMETELHANASKGDRPGWIAMSPATALLEIYWHTAKLSAAVKNGDMALITEHSADVANMAMMLLDVCGGLVPLDDTSDYPPEVWKETANAALTGSPEAQGTQTVSGTANTGYACDDKGEKQ